MESSEVNPVEPLASGKDSGPVATTPPKSADDADTTPSGRQPKEDSGVVASRPEFYEMADSGSTDPPYKLDRFRDVKINVWAELGRVTIPIGELLQLGRGSVVKLNRSLSEPVDIMAQGVRMARGEVVVVDDSFAVRIKEIDSRESESSKP